MEDKYMMLALKEALKASRNNDVPVGAVIVKNQKVIAKAHNKREKKRNAIFHAEILAINKACKKLNSWRLNGCTMYVTLEPCEMCMAAIKQSRIDNILYGTKSTKNIEYQTKISEFPKFEKECSDILQTFFQNRRN